MNAHRREFFRPLVESLEPRRLLACDVQLRQGTLTILGDKSDNVIDVFVSRQGVQVACDGKPSGPFEGVQAILVDSRGGDDSHRFDAEATLGAGPLEDTDGEGLPEIVDFYGGVGRDAFHVLASPTKKLTLDGGQHEDAYDIQFGRLFGAVRVNDTGQAGDDRLKLLGTPLDEKFELNGGGHDGWIAKWEGPDLDAAGNEVRIESIEIAHEGFELGEVATGDGDDQVTVDDRDGRLAVVPLNIRGGAGDLQGSLLIAKQQALRDRVIYGVRLFDGGGGTDRLTIDASGDVGNRFGIEPGQDAGFIEIDVSGIATKSQFAHVTAVNQDLVTIKGGDGDDEYDFDVNDDGVVTPVDTLAGGGTDKLTISASLLAELIEIVGVHRVTPDPLIRGTVKATGAMRFEVSAFDTEAITVDARGGDDTIMMREQDAPLAMVDWTILAGAGHDVVAARLAAVPERLQVRTDQGDDEVSLVVAENPNVPSPPHQPEAPLPEISVDVGAGVDSVMLDVFSTAGPDLQRGDIAPQVTLTEVLASIFVTGVGLLELLTLFPLGAMEMSQAIRDDRAGHVKSETEAALTIAGPNLDLDLTTRATEDSILIGLLTQASGVVDLDLKTGPADDRIDVQVLSTAGSLQQKVRIDSGAGDDNVAVNLPGDLTDGLAELIVGAGPGAGPHVKAFDAATHAEVRSFFAYAPGFAGGVRVAAGDVNGDGVADIITGAGPGGGPHVKVFDGRTHAELHSFFAYAPSFAGGVFVAAGDVNGDGRADIITGAGESATGGHVKVFDGRTGTELQSFLAYPGFSGGVRVAVGDVNGDGLAEVITAPGPGEASHVKVFDGGTGEVLMSFLAYGDFQGGVNVGAGDVNGDGFADIITGADADPQAATGGHVKVFDGQTGSEFRSFFAFPGFAGGVRVAAGDVNGDGFADVITGTGPGAPGGHVKVFDGQTHAELRSFFAFSQAVEGGVYVAAGDLHSAARPKRLDLDLAIDAAGGDDLVKVESDAAADELQQKVRVEGGAGADGLAVVLRRLANPALPPNPGGRLAMGDLTQVELDGGGGDDRLSFDFLGAIAARQSMDVVLRGGAGDDRARARFDLAPESTGRLSAQVHGEAGQDDLELAVLNAGDLDLLFALLDGGPGRDRCLTTDNVIVRNCP